MTDQEREQIRERLESVTYPGSFTDEDGCVHDVSVPVLDAGQVKRLLPEVVKLVEAARPQRSSSGRKSPQRVLRKRKQCLRCDGSGEDHSEWDFVCRVCDGTGETRNAR